MHARTGTSFAPSALWRWFASTPECSCVPSAGRASLSCSAISPPHQMTRFEPSTSALLLSPSPRHVFNPNLSCPCSALALIVTSNATFQKPALALINCLLPSQSLRFAPTMRVTLVFARQPPGTTGGTLACRGRCGNTCPIFPLICTNRRGESASVA
jgi:hypothetical protein